MNKKAGIFGLLVALVIGFEGFIQIDYTDPVGIPTACVGHTGPDVHVGKFRSADECRALLDTDLQQIWDAVDRLVTVPMEPYQQAAFTSFAFNVGIGAFASSTLLKLANSGQMRAACDQLLRWTKAKGGELPGLVKRRKAERELCLGHVEAIGTLE